MWEKLKTGCLIFLILCSILLTYRLWFSRPPLEEGTMPRYEYVYFTSPPATKEIIQPTEIVFYDEGQIHLFRRGGEEYRRLWMQGWQALTRQADLEKVKRNNNDDLEIAWEAAACKLVFSFQPLLPLEFIFDQQAVGKMEIQKIIVLWDKGCCTVFLVGTEIFSLFFPDDDGLEELIPIKNNPCVRLPSLLVFNGSGELAAAKESGKLQKIGGDLNAKPSTALGEPVFLSAEEWEVNIPQEIFLEQDNLFAAEIFQGKNNLQYDDLVKAFFLDLSLARRIEERDGAFYFTNGEKGLRIYASGLVEYTAPRLEGSPRQRLSYGQYLHKGAESQSIYGGFLPDTYLCDARETRGGYRLHWCRTLQGLDLVGENVGCEMLLGGQGVSFLRRNFWLAGPEVTVRYPFRPYEEALWQALFLQQERLQEKKATLLGLKPVFYLPAENGARAIPAWAINFAETGIIYLHWSTLELLEDQS